MNIQKKQILIVDDSPDDIHFLMPALRQDYAVLVATDGDSALKIAAREPHPDVILMDVEMPDINGYETCRKLKKTPATAGIDVIFVSSHDTTEEILSGYDAGGSDYLTKPIQPAELLQKIKLSIENQKCLSTASKNHAEAMEVATTAISSAGEQGVVIKFMRNSFTTASATELGGLIAESIADYGLRSCVQIRGNEEIIHAGNREVVAPLEKEILSRLKDSGRIREVGLYMVLNSADISILIKNMPEDEGRRGRLRDHLAILLEGAEARLIALNLQQGIAGIVVDSNHALLEIEDLQRKQKESSVRIMDEVVQKFELSIASFGLTEEQETILLEILQAAVDKSLENQDEADNIEQQLRGIIDHLTSPPLDCK